MKDKILVTGTLIRIKDSVVNPGVYIIKAYKPHTKEYLIESLDGTPLKYTTLDGEHKPIEGWAAIEADLILVLKDQAQIIPFDKCEKFKKRGA